MLYDGVFQTFAETLELYIDIEITLIQLYKLLFVENDKLNTVLFDYLAYLKDTSVIDNEDYIRLKAIADKELADV